jgi:hypothetical protein
MHACLVFAAAIVIMHQWRCDVYSPWRRVLSAAQKLCARAWLYQEQGSVRKRQMLVRLKPSSVGKFVLHRCNPHKCSKFLSIGSQNFDVVYPGKCILETWIIEDPLYMSIHSVTIWGEYYATFPFTFIKVQTRLPKGEIQIFTKSMLL